MKYRVGMSSDEISESVLNKSGLIFNTVEPRKQLVSSAKSAVGKTYKWGASVLRDAPESFDCSSLIAWAAVESGIAIPRISIDQFVFSKRITKEELVPGDLVFSNTEQVIHTDGEYFSQVLGINVKEKAIRTETLEFKPGTKVPEGVDHVGMYVGDNKIIHASGKQGRVVEETLEGNAAFKNIIGYGRIIDSEEKRFVVHIPDDKPELRTKENVIKYLLTF
ncbi:MAG: phenylalanyl-tRNA synthetase subunit beta, phenylalanyl-tRNA synthetase beta chain [Parcubacteria group bacterium]|nr:phenylalanyl-tRNA synthetase subunit beta, phenylalanyl-tRNA synthetase beta chain [Parcubacteria group bacterium]